MKTAALCILVALIPGVMLSAMDSPKLTIGYAITSSQLTPEDSAAISWLKEHSEFSPRLIQLSGSRDSLRDVDIIWVHIPDSSEYRLLAGSPGALDRLKGAMQHGVKMLFTDYGALLPYDLGIEHKRPAVRIDTIQNDWLWDKKGFQSFRGHPLFAGLFGGEYVWDANEDQVLPFVGYFGKEYPADGAVIAVEKSYVFLHEDRKLVIEHNTGVSSSVSIGATVYFSRDNNMRLKLDRFLENTLLYLAGRNTEGPVTYWRKFEDIPRRFSVTSSPVPVSDGRLMRQPPASGLLLTRNNPANEFFDVAGRRALIMGKENGGLDEVWIHPFRALRDFEAGIIGPDSVAWLKNMPVRIEVRPESFTRYYTIPGGQLKEVVVASLHRAGGIIHYEARASSPVRLMIRFRGDLRWMWPYANDVLGDIHYAFDEGMQALHMRDTSGSFYCLMGADAAPGGQLSGQYGEITWNHGGFAGTPTDLNQVYHAAWYELAPKNSYVLNYAFVGTNEGKDTAMADYRALLSAPDAELAEMVQHYRQLLSSTVTITSPDQEFNRLFKWAVIATDRFFVRTPGVGTGLLAGYGTTERGWDGGQKISGRPGYAWYFGRDSEWSGFAIDDYGDCGIVRDQLGLLQSYQDQYGKIFHEISTSGIVHYDAADATPMYIMLAAHYLRASGDLAFIRESWPVLKRAMAFLYSTDTDGDGLIENTNVGHGWVEGGALFGAHSTLYLSALWVQVLKDMSYMADRVGEQKDLVRKYAADAGRVRGIVNDAFYNDSTHFYCYGKDKDGSYRPEPTVLPAVAMYLNLLDDARVTTMLHDYAGNGFTSDWGVRILSSRSPLFKPQGYHYGSVWPLFTGWAALAEYEYGNSAQGFMHVVNNLYIKNNWALGFVEEVMHGAIYRPSGVCAHQCWSETNILHPAITGMVGWKPDALDHAAALKPRFPLQWDSVTVSNLRVGESMVQLAMKRSAQRTVYTLTLQKGAPVRVAFAPEIPVGMNVKSVAVGGTHVQGFKRGARGLLVLASPVDVSASVDVVLDHTGGFGMIPVMPRPLPGDSSAGYRIISVTPRTDGYVVSVEGKSGTEGVFQFRTFDRPVDRVQGAAVVETKQAGVYDAHVRFANSPVSYGTKQFTVSLK